MPTEPFYFNKNKVTRVFQTEEIVEAMKADLRRFNKDENYEPSASEIRDYLATSSDHYEMGEFDEVLLFVFEADGENWAVTYRASPGTGYDEFFGTESYGETELEIDQTEFLAVKVKKVVKVTYAWEPVEDLSQSEEQQEDAM